MIHMEIRKVTDNKKQYMELLLLGDEQESMIDRYLGRGTMSIKPRMLTVIISPATGAPSIHITFA